MKLVLLALSWVLGVLLGLQLTVALIPFLLLLGGALALGVVLAFWQRVRLAALLPLVLLLGLAWSQWGATPQEGLARFHGPDPLSLQGLVVSDPEPRGRALRFVLEAQAVDRGEGWQEAQGKVMVYAQPSAELVQQRDEPFFRYGDRLLLQGTLKEPPRFEGFDYQEYLARQGIDSVLYFPQVTLSGQGGATWLRWVYELRGRLAASLESALPESQASLAQTLLLGRRSGLPEEVTNAFRRSGTSHLLAISGLHVSILLGLAVSFSAWLLGRRRNLYLLLPLLLLWVYAFLTGFPPSVARAAIMGTIFLAALALGRPGSVLPALALAAGVLVGLTPPILRDASFQLSFTAMAGLALIAPAVERRLKGWLGGFDPTGWQRTLAHRVAEMAAASFAATVATLPLVAFNFQYVPTLGIPATILALPALPFILVTSLLTSLVGLASPLVAQGIGWLAWVPLTYLGGVAQTVALIPGTSVAVPRLGAGLVWVYYSLLVGYLLVPRSWRLPLRGVASLWGGTAWLPRVPDLTHGSRLKVWSVVILALLAALLWTAALSGPDGRLHVLFLDVGQGDAVLIVTPRGGRVLIDGGPEPLAAVRALGRHLPLWERNLDLVVLTHPQVDHLEGLIEVLQRYRVGRVLEGVEQPSSVLYQRWQQVLRQQRAPFVRAVAGQRVVLDGNVLLEVLHPPPEPLRGTGADVNNNSVVLRVIYGESSVLLTGDVGRVAEFYLLDREAALASTVLKVAHHGSDSSSDTTFLASVRPQLAVISAGQENPFGHPSPAVMERLQAHVGGPIYQTAFHGTVEVLSDGRRLWVKTEGPGDEF
ncbi:MAG: DNA internalization-related competence protein ComEC/Rec2 [Dehalococcoidia bacterium]